VAFRHALRIGVQRYRGTAAVVALTTTVVGVTISVAAEIALLTLIVAAALVVERKASEGGPSGARGKGFPPWVGVRGASPR
jgi:hypothetical protein